MKIIDGDTILAHMDYGKAIEALRNALTGDFDPADDSARVSAELSRGEFLFMPAELGRYCGFKALTVTPDNPDDGHPRIQGSYLLLDSYNHTTLAYLDGIAITNIRTPAVSLAGVKDVIEERFPDGVRLALYGVGPQALPHVDATAAVTQIHDVKVGVKSLERADEVLAGLEDRGLSGSPILSGSEGAEQALHDCDLIITATSASEPLFNAASIRKDAIVVAIGSHSPDCRELPAELLGRGTVIVEAKHTAEAECGDLVLAIAENELTIDDVVTFRDVVCKGTEILDPDKPVVFKTSGMSWEDLAIASAVYEALER